MNNLTTTLLDNHFEYNVEEWAKQGQALVFDSGREQRGTKTAIPSISIDISYRGLSEADYEIIRTAYEENHANTFICDLGSFIDKRPLFMTVDASTWVFNGFTFSIDARSRLYSGKITLLTSVFFNFPEYQNLFAQSSSYTRSTSSDSDFLLLLEDVPQYRVQLSYLSNSLISKIGQSARHMKDRGGLLRTWGLEWLLTESQFTQLLTFYRKKAGIMGEFGMPENWVEIPTITNARFQQDSFQYTKGVDGLYRCKADIMEVKI